MQDRLTYENYIDFNKRLKYKYRIKSVEYAVNMEFYFYDLYNKALERSNIKLPLYLFNFDRKENILFDFTTYTGAIVRIFSPTYPQARKEYYKQILSKPFIKHLPITWDYTWIKGVSYVY